MNGGVSVLVIFNAGPVRGNPLGAFQLKRAGIQSRERNGVVLVQFRNVSVVMAENHLGRSGFLSGGDRNGAGSLQCPNRGGNNGRASAFGHDHAVSIHRSDLRVTAGESDRVRRAGRGNGGVQAQPFPFFQLGGSAVQGNALCGNRVYRYRDGGLDLLVGLGGDGGLAGAHCIERSVRRHLHHAGVVGRPGNGVGSVFGNQCGGQLLGFPYIQGDGFRGNRNIRGALFRESNRLQFLSNAVDIPLGGSLGQGDFQGPVIQLLIFLDSFFTHGGQGLDQSIFVNRQRSGFLGAGRIRVVLQIAAVIIIVD